MLITVKYEWWLDIFANALRGALLNAMKWETNGMEESGCGPPSLAIRCSVEAVNRRRICLPSSLSDWALCLQHASSSSLTQRVHFTSFSLIRMWCYTKTQLACSLLRLCTQACVYVCVCTTENVHACVKYHARHLIIDRTSVCEQRTVFSAAISIRLAPSPWRFTVGWY